MADNEEMVERVAILMWNAGFGENDAYDTLSLHNQDIAKDMARAGIAAMREPTESMKLVGARSIGRTMGETNHIQRSLDCWQAMIDAALPSPPEGTG